jgi:hypothetical protein
MGSGTDEPLPVDPAVDRVRQHRMTQSERNRRRYFRLQYPLSDRPSLSLDGHAFEVSELSEGGLKLFLDGDYRFYAGQSIEGIITFHDESVTIVRGVVSRASDVEVVVVNLEGISFNRMVIEQQQLIRKYTNLYEA